MAALLDYIWLSTFSMLIFFGIYWLFLRNEKALRLSRIYLLVSPLLALAMPLVNIPVDFAKPSVSLDQTQFYRALAVQEAPDNFVATFGLPEITVQGSKLPILWTQKDYLFLFYFLVLFMMSLRLVWIFIQMRMLTERGWYQTRYNLKYEYFLIPTFGLAPIFSYFNKLFWDDTHQLNKEEEAQILQHEIEHIKQGHTYDLVYYQVLTTLFWFNPGIYLLRSALVDVHEYLADDQVIHRLPNREAYPKLVVKMAFKGIDLPVGSYFSKSTTLKRILMMKKTPKINWFKSLMVFPLSFLLMALVSMKTERGLGFLSSNITSNLEDIRSRLVASQDSLDFHVKVKRIQNPMHYELISEWNKGKLQAQIGELVYEFSDIYSDEDYVKVRGLIRALRGTSVHYKDYSGALKRYQVDEPARPEAGMATWQQNIMQEVQIPQKELELGLGGVLQIEFIVDEKGEVIQPVIKSSFGGGLDEKVLPLVKRELWVPAKKNGKSVSSVQSVSFAFYPPQQEALADAHHFFNSAAAPKASPSITQTDDEIFDVVEQAPEFKGGMQAWNEYINKNLSYPEAAKSNGIEGTVYLVFVINQEGQVENPEILRGVGFGLDEEALRLVSESPDWNPGSQRGKTVNVRMRLPVKFQLTNTTMRYRLSYNNIAEDITVFDSKGLQDEKSPKPSMAFMEYMRKNLRYPVEAREAGLIGTVMAAFKLDKNGNVKDIVITQSPSEIFSKEVLRVLEQNKAQWHVEGVAYGQEVKMPVTFQMAHLPKPLRSHLPNEVVVTGYNSTRVDTKPKVKDLSPSWTIHGEPGGIKLESDPSSNMVFVIDGEVRPDFIPNTDLKPKDIKQLEIVKGDKAMELVPLYGEKALNGVILIQTNK